MRPEAGGYVGSYVKVLHNFNTDLAGEVSLVKGEVFKVTEVIDKNWLHGTNGEKEGNFPADFVEKVNLPRTEVGQAVFAATENFPAQQDGDLGFCRGDIILGLAPIDDNWWQGQCGGQQGIFPLTHVTELEISSVVKQRSKSVHATETLFAQALVDAVGQLDEELSFQAGDIIKVTEVVDEDWYIGEVRGKSGMFLAACVQLLNESECISAPEQVTNRSNVAHTKTPNSVKNDVTSSYLDTKRHSDVPAIYTPDSHTSCHNDNVTLAYTSENTKAHNDSEAGVTPYARTLYQFLGEHPDELSFEANDIVTLIQHVDEQWIEGEIDGRIGLLPANYVEIVVDCPYAYIDNLQHVYNESSNLNQNDANANSLTHTQDDKNVSISKTTDEKSKKGEKCATKTEPVRDVYSTKNGTAHADKKIETEEHYALVLYDFTAETAQDITVHEGDTVTVIQQIDDNWVLVRNDVGIQGMCPRTFVDIVGALSAPAVKSHDNNDNEIKTIFNEQNINKVKTAVKTETNNQGTDKAIVIDKEVHGIEDVESVKKHNNQQSAIKDNAKQKINTEQGNQAVKRVVGVKPQIKPKPILAPKPALKPKPSLSSKPWAPSTLKPVTFDPKTSIPKSTSSKSLSQYAESDTGTMTKAQSMFEINNQSDLEVVETSLSGSRGSNPGSTSSLNSNSERRNSSDSHSKKVFEDWDLTKPLDSLLRSEFVKAKHEADIKSRSSSIRSSGSSGHSQKSDGVDETDHSTFTHQPGNYLRENFESGLTVGNSFFYDMEPKRTPHLRKPPPPPVSRSSSKEDFTRRPSLKRPAPPRPVGPRLAPVPSKTPIVPTKATPPKITPHRPAPPEPSLASSRPQEAPRKLARPAPPRPQGNPARPVGDNLMSFSPPNSSLCKPTTSEEGEEDTEAVQELRKLIEHLQSEIQALEKSKHELEQMRQHMPDDTEIHDNIQFYTDNIQGVNEELQTLREQLAVHSPRERDKMDQEKLAEERKLEEERLREEQRRRREVEKEERKDKRMRVIGELIQTEKDFLTSLHLIMETFLSPAAEKHKEVDVEHLFGNIEEVAEVSQKLLTKLEDATNGKDFSQQVIGTCFVYMAEDMKNVYAPYCRNHDDVITLIEKYYQNADVKTYLERLLDKLRERHVVFDLEALLIKPVQRILKYPLLLNELIKSTEDDHPDKKEVMLAIKAMTDVATAINEYKRRKDLVFKYKKDTEASLGDKLSKLNLHSIKKKSSRIKERFSANLGFIDQTRDPNFDREETRYRHLEKTVRVFVRDVQFYLDEVQSGSGCQESIAADMEDFYAEKRDLAEVTKYLAFQGKIHMTFLPNFRVEVDDLVIYPLNQMLQMFEGPSNVIQKRYDKLLDYDNLKRKSQSDKVFEKQMLTAKQDYEALNAQLLDELPKMYTLASHLLRDCVGSFVRAQRDFTDKILHDMYELLDVGILSDERIQDQFNIRHTAIVDSLALLSFMPKSFSPRVADQKQEKLDKKNKRLSLDPAMLKSSTEAVPQMDSQRVFVTQKYAPEKLFRVTETHIAVDALDISLCEGDVVGVIVEKDPMGNKERWFVDNGAQKGFLPRKYLVSYQASPSRPLPAGGGQLLQPTRASGGQSPASSGGSLSPVHGYHSPGVQNAGSGSGLHSLQEVDDMDFALEEEMIPELDDRNQSEFAQAAVNKSGEEEIELYYAEFPFTSRTENEVSLFEHQVVTVIAMHDQEGNPEWWYVEADGTYGYAPAAYLHKMDTHEGLT